MTLHRDALARSIGVLMGDFNLDELRVVDAVVMRLRLGRERHGELDLSKARDWEREEAEEHVDALIYRACNLISRQDRERAELRTAAARELAHDWPGPADFGGEG